MITKPTINLNGTPPRVLFEDHLAAIEALRFAISTLIAAAPNARDYQTAPGSTFLAAMSETACASPDSKPLWASWSRSPSTFRITVDDSDIDANSPPSPGRARDPDDPLRRVAFLGRPRKGVQPRQGGVAERVGD